MPVTSLNWSVVEVTVDRRKDRTSADLAEEERQMQISQLCDPRYQLSMFPSLTSINKAESQKSLDDSLPLSLL